MIISVDPTYVPITEKPYCCVPAVLQMIQDRRGIGYDSQDEIGYQLGLTVPRGMALFFSKVRTGVKPFTGWGTQTSKEEYSVNNYFINNNFPLKLETYSIDQVENLCKFIGEKISDNCDIILCYNSQVLFGDGDAEHVSLIQDIDTESEEITIIDPAIGAPRVRRSYSTKIIHVLKNHSISKLGGLWIISSS